VEKGERGEEEGRGISRESAEDAGGSPDRETVNVPPRCARKKTTEAPPGWVGNAAHLFGFLTAEESSRVSSHLS
jgi:hypothetical protein